MKPERLLRTIAILLCVAPILGAGGADLFTPASPGTVQIEGWLGDKMASTPHAVSRSASKCSNNRLKRA